ncbi:hypothetical protein PR202_gb28202 [Eleusine coracana subsp. coracana]|uniref:Uncharacterized protein n=1 Tax=Eleusine coracana subsp. coracana TaxID=191504 RepID=A0AAV5FX09_ELECO|nr:hypothetical protein QOZ80_6AG0548010 [Eleusine coracana subsp. coracana]GJN39105.1 hypothetical protein PR202_gb28202 [Eleusine coracana subsp. coracana]
MASAVASNLVPAAAAAMPYGWLSPRVSFSAAADDDEPAMSSPVLGGVSTTPEPAISKDFIDFEFSLGGSATMLPADELFADGKLLPLRKAVAPFFPDPAEESPPPPAPAPAQAEAATTTMPAEPIVKPLRAAAAQVAADGTADPYVFSPKAPSCSSRWRELLGLKRAAAHHSPSSPNKPSAATKTPVAAPSRASNSAAARSLKLLLQRNAGRSSASDLSSAPLLRDSSDSEASLSLASSRFSLSSSSSSSAHDHDDIPRLSLDSAAAADHTTTNPPRIRLVRHHQQHHRHSTSSSNSTRAGRSPARRRPSPPRCLSVDSPRMNSSGKIVFQGLERSSSSPCSFHAAASKSRARAAVDRSYSSGVRVAPVVLNVPVCSRPVFGFFKDKTKDSTNNSARSSLGRKAPPQGWSGELPRSCGC